jgi:hypothetical protein
MFTKSIAAQRPFKLALIASFAMVAAAVSAPSLADTTTASASAKVMVPITIAKTADLAFGKFAVNGAAGGTVTVSTSGVRSGSGVYIPAADTTTAARFTITGEANASFSIDLGGPSTTLTGGGGSMTLTYASDLTGGNTTSGLATIGTLTSGTQILYVGGTLAVSGTQVAADYTGTVSATVLYN